MKQAEILARANPICQRYRKLSLQFSYRLRKRLTNGFEYYRDPHNGYTTTLSKGRTRYIIWYFSSADAVFACLDKRMRSSRGITTDPNLEIIVGAAPEETAVEQIIKVLQEHRIIK